MKTLFGATIVACVLTLGQRAYCDVIPPEVWACNKLDAGATCANTATSMGGQSSGVCQPATCSRLDYSHGTPPTGTTSYACLKCTPPVGAGGSTATTVDGGEPLDAGVVEPPIPGSCSCTGAGRVQRYGYGLGLVLGLGTAWFVRRRRSR